MAVQPSPDTSGQKPDEMNADTIEDLWRQAILIRDISRDEIASAQRRREEAEAARLVAEREAIKATEEMCANLREQAEAELEEAHRVLDQTRELEDQVQTNLNEAISIKRQAEQEVTETLRRTAEGSQSEMEAARMVRIRGEAKDARRYASLKRFRTPFLKIIRVGFSKTCQSSPRIFLSTAKNVSGSPS